MFNTKMTLILQVITKFYILLGKISMLYGQYTLNINTHKYTNTRKRGLRGDRRV